MNKKPADKRCLPVTNTLPGPLLGAIDKLCNEKYIKRSKFVAYACQELLKKIRKNPDVINNLLKTPPT